MQTQTSKNKYRAHEVRKKYQTNSVIDNNQQLCCMMLFCPMFDTSGMYTLTMYTLTSDYVGSTGQKTGGTQGAQLRQAGGQKPPWVD